MQLVDMSAKRKVAVVMELAWPYKRHYEIFAGIREYAMEHGNWDLELESFPQFEMQRGKKYHGVIGRITAECFDEARKNKVPVVNVRLDSPVTPKVHGVYPDFQKAGRLAAEHMINRGLKRLVHFGFKRSLASKLHYEGMREFARGKGCSCKRYLVSANYYESERLWKSFVEYINAALETWHAPIGLVVSSDELAHSVTTLCISRGWSIPDQISVIGTNNEVMICNSISPTLSSIDMADRICGYEAAALLNRLLKKKKTVPLVPRYVAPKELVLRRSSDAYAVEDPAMVRALVFMSENTHRKISVSDVANAAGIGRQTLEHRFRRKLKRTVNEELIRLRVSKMKRLLVETEKTIGQISELVGFGTTANMHVMFKRLTGMTPIVYREKHNPKLTQDASR